MCRVKKAVVYNQENIKMEENSVAVEKVVGEDITSVQMIENRTVKDGVKEESLMEAEAGSSVDPVESAIQTMTSKIWEKIKNGAYESAINEINDMKYHQFIRYETLTVVPIIARLLQEDLDCHGKKCVEDVLVYVASVANIKEATLAFLEELEIHNSSAQFLVMLRPIEVLLLRLVSKNTQPNIFSWVFNALYARLVTMKLPMDYNLEGKERKLLDVDPSVLDIVKILKGLTDFYAVFYTRVINEDLVWTGKVTNSREYLARFVLQMFHTPLVYLDIYCDKGEVENQLYRITSQLTYMIANLIYNPFKLFSCIAWKKSKTLMATEENVSEEYENAERDDDELVDTEAEPEERKEVSQLSLSCFFYCVLGQHMSSDILPCVYSHQYVYLCCLPLIANLLQEKEHIPIHKGLVLAKVLLTNLPNDSLTSDTLEAKAHASFPQLLIRIMVYCDNKELRTTALEIFRSYFCKFDSFGRRKLIQGLLLSVKHAGVLGLVIHELKENISSSLQQCPMDPNFCGKNVMKLVLMACTLPDAERTDLLEWSDCIMSALNLLLFLCIRDKEKTGINEVIPMLQKDYLAHLQKGLELSKGHYELKLNELSSSGGKSKQLDASVYVCGSVLPNMPLDQEKNVVQMALCSLDMMQCVLVRVMQAIEN